MKRELPFGRTCYRLVFPILVLLTLNGGQVFAQTYNPTVTTDKEDYQPGEVATLSGTGWTEDTQVAIVLEEEPYQGHDEYFTATVNPDGTWVYYFPIEERHRGVAFHLKATGNVTGYLAETWFTDAIITITSNTNWSAITTGSGPGGQPNSTDQVRIGNNAILTVNVTNAQAGLVSVGIGMGMGNGNGTLAFNSGSILTISPATLSGDIVLGVTTPGRPATLNMALGGILRIGGAMNVVSLSASGITPGTGTIEFNGAGGQTVPSSFQLGSKAYNNLILSGGGTKTFSGATTTSSNLSVASGVVANLGTVTSQTAGSLTLGGLGTINGTWGSLSSSATNKNNTFFSATTGFVTVGTDTRATPIVTPTIGTYVYNGAPIGPTVATNTGTGSSYTFSYSGVGPTIYGPSATLPTNAGNYTVTATVAASIDGFYKQASSVPTAFSIEKAEITVVNTSRSKVYGETLTDGDYTGSISGVVAGDNITVTRASAGDAADATVAGSPYAIVGTLVDPDGRLANYEVINPDGVLTVTKAEITVVNTSRSKVYGETLTDGDYTGSISGVVAGDNITVTRASAGDAADATVAGSPYAIVGTLVDPDGRLANYEVINPDGVLTVTKAPLTITAQNASKFAGQANPTFTVTYDGLVAGETPSVLGGTLVFTTSATVNSCAGNYPVVPSGLTSGNYHISFVGATLTVNGTSVNASASSTPVKAGQAANLTATVTPNVAGVAVTFVLTNESGVVVYNSGHKLTNASGIATATSGILPVGYYKLVASVGTGCSTSIVYIPVYDGSDSFVTGGGWINSPAGAMPAKPTAVGKGEYGFVAKYKKGTTQVEGNIDFTFTAGPLNFKSTTVQNGSLVITGKKAVFRGTGTVNGQAGFNYLVVVIDDGIGGPNKTDKFRIKITNNSGVVIYDNQIGKDENSADATTIGNNGTGGGQIVIHPVAAPGKKRVAPEIQEVAWNTSEESLTKQLEILSKSWFDGQIPMINWNFGGYDALTPGFYQITAEINGAENYDVEDQIDIPILVLNKPLASDIRSSVSVIPITIQAGEVFAELITIDPVDDIHSYSISENEFVSIDGNQLILKTSDIPSKVVLNVRSTDRAGQTIERELVFAKGDKSAIGQDLPAAANINEVIVHPNPAREQKANIQVRLTQAAIVNIRVYDPAGRLVYQDEAFEEASFIRHLDLSAYSNGLYMILVQVDNQMVTKRLVKE